MFKLLGFAMGTLLLAGVPGAMAATPASLMSEYEAAARQNTPGFGGFSADRGGDFYLKKMPSTEGPVACSTCHTQDARASGQTRANKVIDPLAPAANRNRFTDKAKTEKWFRRNCDDVLSRECTPQEKGDFISYLLTLK